LAPACGRANLLPASQRKHRNRSRFKAKATKRAPRGKFGDVGEDAVEDAGPDQARGVPSNRRNRRKKNSPASLRSSKRIHRVTPKIRAKKNASLTSDVPGAVAVVDDEASPGQAPPRLRPPKRGRSTKRTKMKQKKSTTRMKTSG
jgi:hypothetical protein